MALASLKKRFNQFTDLEQMKVELARLADQIQALSKSYLSPKAQAKLVQLRKRFDKLKRQILLLQKQLDREFSVAVKKWEKAKKETERYVRAYIHKPKKKTTTRKATRRKAKA